MRKLLTMCFALLAQAVLLCGNGSNISYAADTVESSNGRALAVKVVPAATLTPAKTTGETKEECEKKEKEAAAGKDNTADMVRTAQDAYEKEKREMQERLNKDAAWQPSYEQSGVIKVSKLAPDREVNSFCLNKDGNILVCCGPKSASSVVGMIFGKARKKEGGGIVQFSPDGKLVSEWSVPIDPQAICLGLDDMIYVAGAGTILKLDPSGKILRTAETPNMSELPPLPKIEKEAKPESPEVAKAKAEETASVQKQLTAAIKDYQKISQEAAKSLKPNDEASMQEFQTKVAEPMEKLQTLHARLADLTTTPEMRAAQIRAQRDRMTTIAGMAVTAQDLFISCTSTKGYGYVVWRVDHDFAHPKRIVENLGGCCGQMDVQAHDGDLWVAHNGRHKVEQYTRDGKKKSSFGRTDRVAADGFGGCCEPKNLRFGPDNVVFACESGPPTCVKRFSTDGKFLGVAVVAPWNSGCVRVTTEYDAQHDRFFVLNAGDKNIHTFLKKSVQSEKKVAKNGKQAEFKQVGDGEVKDFEKYDINELETAPPPELDVDPALEKPAKEVPAEDLKK